MAFASRIWISLRCSRIGEWGGASSSRCSAAWPLAARAQQSARCSIAPCLPSKTDKLPSRSEWLHEIKHNGFGSLARKNGARVRLYSRPGKRSHLSLSPPSARSTALSEPNDDDVSYHAQRKLSRKCGPPPPCSKGGGISLTHVCGREQMLKRSKP
jgi:hypothetical protein